MLEAQAALLRPRPLSNQPRHYLLIQLAPKTSIRWPLSRQESWKVTSELTLGTPPTCLRGRKPVGSLGTAEAPLRLRPPLPGPGVPRLAPRNLWALG